MSFRTPSTVLFLTILIACANDPAASPTSTTTSTTATVSPATTATASVPPSTSSVPSSIVAPGSTPTTIVDQLPERCVARVAPMYPNPATERWVPSPESDDVIREFALLVLGWPDVQVVDEQPDGPVTLVRIASSAATQPVELVVIPDADGRPVSVCSARSVVGEEWKATVLIEGREVVSGFGVRVDLDDPVPTEVHELLPDVVSAQLLISHGPHVQQVAATDPETGWRFELDHPTAEPGWQLAFWRDADGAALAVMDTGLPAGDFAAS